MKQSKAATYYQKREEEIMEACIRHGVMIAPGSVYAPEEWGWFRVTFSLGEDALREGLKRLAVVFVEIDLGMQEASTEANVP
jgi:DNA-binding transcriptional MocR family regulator